MALLGKRLISRVFVLSNELLRKVAVVLLVLLNYIGYVKNNDIFQKSPIDITVLLTGLLALIIIIYLLSSHGQFKNTKNTIITLPLFLFILLVGFSCAFNLNLDSKYSSTKALKFFTITMICIISPFFILKNSRQLRLYYIITLILGFLLCYATLFTALTGGDSLNRTAGLGSNPIAVARLCGFLFMFYAFCVPKNKLSGVVLAFVYVIIPLVVSILTGSRAPTILAIVMVIVTYLLFEKSITKKIFVPALIVILSVTIITVVISSDIISLSAGSRINALISGEVDESTETRQEMAALSLEEIPKYPFGIGLGGFERYNFFDTEEQYPHNIVLEVALELGWLPGIIFIIIVLISIYIGFYVAGKNLDENSKMLFCYSIYFTLNMLISGELNAERTFWSLMSISMSLFINHKDELVVFDNNLIKK